jgi:L-ribulose-5-phosphate 3-epimerase
MAANATRREFLKASVAGAVAWRAAASSAFADAPVPIAERVAVCSWSLRPSSLDDLLAKLAQTGVGRLQIALDPIRANRGGGWTDVGRRCADKGVGLVSGMFETVGEDYTTLETIRRTGGVVPDATWGDNWKNIQANAQLARTLGLKLVTFHAGFLPHEPQDPAFAQLQSRLRQIAELFAAHGIALGMETGQETADTLATFLKQLGRKNVGVNFDPANMILYGKGEPAEALKTLAPWVRQCHVKDALRTKTPGTWGEEVPVGTGEVGWQRLLPALTMAGFRGALCIEREAGSARVADIRTAREFLETQTAATTGR